MRMKLSIPFLLAGLLLGGCLPGDQRTMSREMFPIDSLSRAIGEVTPVDTLERTNRVELTGVEYPVHLTSAEGRYYVADTRNATIYAYDSRDSLIDSFHDPRLEFPFVSGASGDTVAVLSRGQHVVHKIRFADNHEPAIVESIEIPQERNAVAAWNGSETFVKFTDEDTGSGILRLGDGILFELEPPFWRHIGVMRFWGDTLLAASGYRPIVHVMPQDAHSGFSPDSLYLMGFDSPQLPRSRLFAIGSIKEPPLLIPSIVGVGSRLFVMNSRPGWVHIDVFQRTSDGLFIERSLLSPQPELGRQFFAADLAVYETDRGFEILILENRPVAAISRYFWDYKIDHQP